MRAPIDRFILRLVLATGISLEVWFLYVTPLDRVALARDAIAAVVQLLNFPVAVAGEFFYPLRGILLVFDDGGTWCEFCGYGEMMRRQLQLAIPVYLFLMYLPALIRRIARDRRLVRRIVIGLAIYACYAAIFFAINSGGSDFRVAAKWFLILAAAASIAWSNAGMRWKIGGVIAVILDGAWMSAELDTFLTPKVDDVLAFYPLHLMWAIAGVVTLLWLTFVIENAPKILEIFHPRVAHDADDGGAGS